MSPRACTSPATVMASADRSRWPRWCSTHSLPSRRTAASPAGSPVPSTVIRARSKREGPARPRSARQERGNAYGTTAHTAKTSVPSENVPATALAAEDEYETIDQRSRSLGLCSSSFAFPPGTPCGFPFARSIRDRRAGRGILRCSATCAPTVPEGRSARSATAAAPPP